METTTNEVILAAMAAADKDFEGRFDWTANKVKRKAELKGMQQRHQEEKLMDMRQNAALRQRNADYRAEELDDLKRQHEMQEMKENEMDSRRVFYRQDLEHERFIATALRAHRSRKNEDGQGFIPRGILFDLRSQNPKRIFDKLVAYGDQPAIVGQAFLELALLVSGRKDLCESVWRLGGCRVVVDGMQRFRGSFFVQEQGINLIFRLCCTSSCALELVENGAFQVLMEAFESLGDAAECKPIRLMVLRSLESMYGKVGLIAEKRRPAEEERRAMRVICSAMKQPVPHPPMHEAGLRLVSTLGALREANFTWLFEVHAFHRTLRWMLGVYDTSDVRFQRAEAAGVVREVLQLLTVTASSCGTAMMTNLVTELDPSLLDLLAAVLERHAGDPLVQLAYAQMWEVLLDRHLPLIRTVVLTQKVKEVVVTSLSAMKRHLRIHLLQWKHLSNLTILFKAGQSGTAVPKAATMASLLLDNGCVPLFEELVAECASDAETLAALLRLLLAYGNDFRFRVACNREDETGLRDSLQSALALHTLNPEVSRLGRCVMAKIYVD